MNCKIHAESYDEIIEKNWPAGIKKTRQRIDIFRILYASDLPLSAAEIFNSLTGINKNEQYAFSTVYRNLLAFEKAGIITKSVLTTEDNAVYELKTSSHRHYAVCLKCHKKFPINACPLSEISKNIYQSVEGFSITGHQLEVFGYCRECQI